MYPKAIFKVGSFLYENIHFNIICTGKKGIVPNNLVKKKKEKLCINMGRPSD